MLNSLPQINPLHYLLNFLLEKRMACAVTLVSMCLSVCPHTLPSVLFHVFEKSGTYGLPLQGTVLSHILIFY